MRRRGMGVVGRVRRVRERKSVVVVVVGVTYIRVMSISMYIDRQIDRIRQVHKVCVSLVLGWLYSFGLQSLVFFLHTLSFFFFSCYGSLKKNIQYISYKISSSSFNTPLFRDLHDLHDKGRVPGRVERAFFFLWSMYVCVCVVSSSSQQQNTKKWLHMCQSNKKEFIYPDCD